MAWIHAEAAGIPLDEQAIKRLHALTRGQIWDAGQYKEKDGGIIERYPDGSERVRFRTVPAAETSARMADLVQDWRRCLIDRWVPPLIALAAFNLDFQCVHPFRDGNGRVSRLLWLLQSYQLGYEVGRYISLERVGETRAPRGAKTDQVNAAIEQFAGEFSIVQLELRCPGVSRDTVRRVLREQQAAGKIERQGRGPAAKWRKRGFGEG